MAEKTTGRVSQVIGAVVDVTFDGQSQARLFGTASSASLVTAILPTNVARDFRKSSLMVAVAKGGSPIQFSLTATGPLLPVLANCVAKMKTEGVERAGDFAVPKTVAAAAATETPGAARPARPSCSGRGRCRRRGW